MRDRPKCVGIDGKPCRFYAVGGGSFCAKHDPSRAEERREEMRRRGVSGRAKQLSQRAPREAVDLSTPRKIREYLERTAALLESASGGKVERANAAIKLCQAAATMLKDELEKRAAEIAALLEKYPELARRLEGDATQ